MKKVTEKRLEKALVALSEWFARNRRVLPWRNNPSVYRVWVSEIMLQQTQVITAVPYFNRFLKRFPTLEKLASAKREDVMRQWAGLGYYSRARNLHAAARMVRDAGKYPSDRAGWLALPGVGEYTAGAVLSIALGRPEAILDANVKRVIARMAFFSEAPTDDKSMKKKYWDISGRLVKTAAGAGIGPSVTNQALMELGALVCKNKNPSCGICPLSGICMAYGEGDPERAPVKIKKKKVSLRETVYAVINGKGQVLLTDSGGRWRKGLWDFPQELPRGINDQRFLFNLEIGYAVTNHDIKRACRVYSVKRKKAFQAAEFRWVNAMKPSVAVGAPCRKLLELIGKELVR